MGKTALADGFVRIFGNIARYSPACRWSDPSAICVFIFCLLCALPLPAVATESIRVAIVENGNSVVLKSAAGLLREGIPTDRMEKRIVFRAGSPGLYIARLRSADGFVQVNGVRYRGVVEIRSKKNGSVLVVNDLDLEEYLLGVVAEEMPHDWEPEALRAQAVVARTFALYKKRAAGRRPYHVRATVNGQVYTGVRGERPSATSAVRETRGLVLAFAGGVIPAFFHSSCGGHTEDAAELWNINAPYLKGVACDCQNISKYAAWEKRIGIGTLTAALRKRGYSLNTAESMRIGTLTRTGRVREIEVIHNNGSIMITAEKIRQAVGYAEIPSLFFDLDLSGNEVVFSGRGLGHGVGLCQWGARKLAIEGWDYRAILDHYYPGTMAIRIDDL